MKTTKTRMRSTDALHLARCLPAGSLAYKLGNHPALNRPSDSIPAYVVYWFNLAERRALKRFASEPCDLRNPFNARIAILFG